MIRGRWKGSQAQGPNTTWSDAVPGSGLTWCTHARTRALCTRASSGAGPGPAQPGACLPPRCPDAYPGSLLHRA